MPVLPLGMLLIYRSILGKNILCFSTWKDFQPWDSSCLCWGSNELLEMWNFKSKYHHLICEWIQYTIVLNFGKMTLAERQTYEHLSLQAFFYRNKVYFLLTAQTQKWWIIWGGSDAQLKESMNSSIDFSRFVYFWSLSINWSSKPHQIDKRLL